MKSPSEIVDEMINYYKVLNINNMPIEQLKGKILLNLQDLKQALSQETNEMTIIRKDFIEVLRDCEAKLKQKDKEYRNSWKTMPVNNLYPRLWEEVIEYNRSSSYEEIIDIINVALMIATRMKGVDKHD